MTDSTEYPVTGMVPAIMPETGQLDPSVMPGAAAEDDFAAAPSPLRLDADGRPMVPRSEIAARYEGHIDALGTPQWLNTQIADTVAYIATRVPTAIPRLISRELSLRDFYRIVAAVVLRIARNPGGITQEVEGGHSIGLSQAVASGYVILRPEDIDILAGVRTDLGIGTIDVGFQRGWYS